MPPLSKEAAEDAIVTGGYWSQMERRKFMYRGHFFLPFPDLRPIAVPKGVKR